MVSKLENRFEVYIHTQNIQKDKIYPYIDKKKTFGKYEREVKLCIEQEDATYIQQEFQQSHTKFWMVMTCGNRK